MQLSAPIYALKRKAKLLARATGTARHKALDKVAADEGFRTWSHLASHLAKESPARWALSQLAPGDLALVGARPGHGKTLLGLELAVKAAQMGRKGYFFTLDYNANDVAALFSAIENDVSARQTVIIDTSDDVSADYIVSRLETETAPGLIVVDYLQLLDQKRANPSLEDQMNTFQRYVRETGAICVVLSQIDRAFELSGKSMPDISDIRLPNPLDLSVFRKSFFLQNGRIKFDQVA